MIIVHHLEKSRSQRIRWLLEELGLPYEVKRYVRERRMGAPAELKRVYPLDKSPIVEDHGLMMAETGAIAAHLVESAGRWARPQGARKSSATAASSIMPKAR